MESSKVVEEKIDIKVQDTTTSVTSNHEGIMDSEELASTNEVHVSYTAYIDTEYAAKHSELPVVKSPEIFLKGINADNYHPEGLFSEQLFGPLRNNTCQCNVIRYNAEDVRCIKCKVKFSKSTRSDQEGVIKLPFRIISPQLFHLMLKFNSKFQSKVDKFEIESIDEMFELLDALYFYDPKNEEDLIPREGPILNTQNNQIIDDLNNQVPDIKLSNKLIELKNIVKNNPELLFKFNILVIPPDLRPISGGKLNFVADEMNHYYQKILEHLVQLENEEIKKYGYHRLIITKILYQSYLTELIDKIPSKQGHFRQKIYGKRVDFSGRTVATIDCSLNMNQIKVPFVMLAKVWTPFIIHQHPLSSMSAYNDIEDLTNRGTLSKNLKDTINAVAKRIPLALNRQPTLHRPSLRTFNVIPCEGLTIKVNPYIAEGFNLDFDGDQMAIYAPLFEEEIDEMLHKLINHKNQIQPGTLKFASVHQFGYSVYMMTKKEPDESKILYNVKLDDVLDSDNNITTIETLHKEYLQSLYEKEEFVKRKIATSYHGTIEIEYMGEKHVTTLGRAIISIYLNKRLNEVINKRRFNEIVSNKLLNIIYKVGHREFTYKYMKFLDELLHKHLIQMPITISLRDFTDIYELPEYIETVDKLIKSKTSMDAKLYADEIESIIKNNIQHTGNLIDFINSGAKGSFSSIKQLLGAKGTVMSPQGAMVPYYIKRNFMVGLSEKDMYIMSFGSRKGSLDRSVNTGETGYLTRKLIFALQEGEHDVNIEDCGTTEYIKIKLTKDLFNAYMFKNVSLFEDYLDYKKDNIITLIPSNIESFEDMELKLWTQIHCKSEKYCRKCYGEYSKVFDSRYVGVIAAEALGERCTQLTMRTFHTGGVAEDIRDFINKEFMKIEDDKIVATKRIAFESIETEDDKSNLSTDYELDYDLYLIEKEKEIELQLPKGCVLNINIDIKTVIQPNTIIARIPSNKTSSVTSIVDYIMKTLEKPTDGYTYEELYQLLLDAFYHTEGILSSHIETVVAQMMRTPNDYTKFSRLSDTPEHYHLISIKVIPALRRLLGIGFEYFHKNLLTNMIEGYGNKLKNSNLSIMEKVLSGVTTRNLELVEEDEIRSISE